RTRVRRAALAVGAAAVLAGAVYAGSVLASGERRGFDIRVGDSVFANDAGVICTDQLLTALKSTQPFTATLGRYALVCIPEGGSLLRDYTVRYSELGVIVENGGR